MLLALATKDANGAGKPADTADRLARAFTLLQTAYNACRRAAGYLRWEQGDVDDLAPPLTRKTPGRKPGSASKGRSVEAADESEGSDAGDAESAEGAREAPLEAQAEA
jgi:hypothetical protein